MTVNHTPLSGVIVPVITPVTAQDSVDEAAYRQVIRRLIALGVDGLFIGGSAGEGPLLTFAQWQRMMSIALETAQGSVPVLGGVADTSTSRVLEKVGYLRELGYAYTVLTPTFYMPSRSPDEQLRIFGAVKEHCGEMELVAYNIPGCTNAEIALETLCEMTRRGWIQYCKESSGNRAYCLSLIAEASPLGLQVIIGDETLLAEGMLAGAKGVCCVCANFEPQTYQRLVRSAQNKQTDDVRFAQQRVLVLRQQLVMAGACWVAGVKYSIACLGIGNGQPVSPLQPLTALEEQAVREFVAASSDC